MDQDEGAEARRCNEEKVWKWCLAKLSSEFRPTLKEGG